MVIFYFEDWSRRFLQNISNLLQDRGMWWCSWLRHCTTSCMVAGSIPDGVGIFHSHNHSSLTIAQGLTQPLTETSTRNVSWGERRPVRRADNLTTFMCHLSWNLRTSASWKPQGLSRPVMGFIIKSFQSSWSIGHPWKASRHYISSYPLGLVPWSSCASYFILYCPSPRSLRPPSSSISLRIPN